MNDKPKEEMSVFAAENTSLKSLFVYLLISAVLLLLCYLVCNSSETRYCKWCGHQEKCKKYTVTILEGYNADGSHKYRRESVYIGNDCISKAKSNGIERGWIEIK